MSHPYVRDDESTEHRCQCGRPGCSDVHDRPTAHFLWSTSTGLFEPDKLKVVCICGAEALYDLQWGIMVVPSAMWRRVERQLQEVAA